MQDDILVTLSKFDKKINIISDDVKEITEKILYFNSISDEDLSTISWVYRKTKDSMIILSDALKYVSGEEEKEEFDLYGKDYPIDYPITSYIDEDGFYVVKFDFDIPVIKHKFDTNDKICLARKITNLTDFPKLDDVFLAYEFHQGSKNFGADLKEIENRDMRYITDLLVGKYSNNGDYGKHFREYRYSVQDDKYYTNAYILDIKNIAKFIEKYP